MTQPEMPLQASAFRSATHEHTYRYVVVSLSYRSDYFFRKQTCLYVYPIAVVKTENETWLP